MGNVLAWLSVPLAAAVGGMIWNRCRPRLSALDREAGHLVDQDALADLMRRLVQGPVAVRARTATTLAGPFLYLDLGGRCLRVRLYGGWCLNEAGRQSTSRRPLGAAEIVGVHDLGTRGGYLVALETVEGRLRYHGWQIEQVVAPKAPARPATFLA